jgi:hypothetical protein
MSTTAESGVDQKGTENQPAEPTNSPKQEGGGVQPHGSGLPGPRDPAPDPTATGN